jgi:hypothetical protein
MCGSRESRWASTPYAQCDIGSPVRVVTVAVSGMAAGAVVATAVQVHHAVGLFAHLCS